jgi:hypothetical protein
MDAGGKRSSGRMTEACFPTTLKIEERMPVGNASLAKD